MIQLTVDGITWPGSLVVGARITAPQIKPRIVDVPGAHGDLDLSTANTGGEPIFYRRTLTAKILVWCPDADAEWVELQAKLNGRSHNINLDGLPGHWSGRCQIGGAAVRRGLISFTLAVSVDPWRWDDQPTQVIITGAADPGVPFTLTPTAFTVAPIVQASGPCTIVAGGRQWSLPNNPDIAQALDGLLLRPGAAIAGQVVGAGITVTFAWTGGRL